MSQMYGPSYDRVVDALRKVTTEGRSAGQWTKFMCPVPTHGDGHGDRNPSLGVLYDGSKERTRIECFGNCPQEAVLVAAHLEVRDLFDKPLERGQRSTSWQQRRPQQQPRARMTSEQVDPALSEKPKQDLGEATGPREIVERYPYPWWDGSPYGEVVRQHTQHERGVKKDFYQRHWAPETQRFIGGGFPPVPFRAPELAEALAAGESTVWIVEGEQDANRAWQAGLAATCNVGGAGKFRREHAQQLRQHGVQQVVIVADKDKPGLRHAASVRTLLAEVGVDDITVVQAATGKDLSEHFDAGHDVSELIEIPPTRLALYDPDPAQATASRAATDEIDRRAAADHRTEDADAAQIEADNQQLRRSQLGDLLIDRHLPDDVRFSDSWGQVERTWRKLLRDGADPRTLVDAARGIDYRRAKTPVGLTLHVLRKAAGGEAEPADRRQARPEQGDQQTQSSGRRHSRVDDIAAARAWAKSADPEWFRGWGTAYGCAESEDDQHDRENELLGRWHAGGAVRQAVADDGRHSGREDQAVEHEKEPEPKDVDPQPDQEGAEQVTEQHSSEVDHVAKEFAAITRMLMAMITAWAQRAAQRRLESMEAARRISEAEAAEYEKQLNAERKMAAASLKNVGTEQWWKNASHDEVMDAWGTAMRWAEDDKCPQAAQAVQAMRQGLRDKYGIDVDQMIAYGKERANGELSEVLRSAYLSGAALERSEAAQRFAVSAVARTKDIPEDRRRELYSAIDTYAMASAKVLSVRGARTPALALDQHQREAARAKIEFLLSDVPQQHRDEVLFSLDYLTGDDRANPGRAKLGAQEVTKVQVDGLLEMFQTRLFKGRDTKAVTDSLEKLMHALTPEERNKVRGRGREIIDDPAKKFGRLWPKQVDKVALARHLRDYAELVNGDDDTEETRTKKAKARAEIDGQLGKSGLARIEAAQLKLTLADVDSPGLIWPPGVIWADRESQLRRTRGEQAAEAKRVVNEAMSDVETYLMPQLDEQQREQIGQTLAEYRRDTEHLAAGGDRPRDTLNRLTGYRNGLSGDMVHAEVPQATQRVVIETLTKLDTDALRCASTISRARYDVQASLEDENDYDTKERRADRAYILQLEGHSEAAIEAVIAADVAQATPASQATEAPKTAPKARQTRGSNVVDIEKGRSR